MPLASVVTKCTCAEHHLVQGKSDAMKTKANSKFGKLVLQACAPPRAHESCLYTHATCDTDYVALYMHDSKQLCK
jgi:hypothetical protein